MRKVLAAVTALGMVSAGAVATVAPVAADEVWHQAFQRPGQDVVCQAPADETPWQASFGGQRAWTPSWAQWANHDQGGWVCQRSIEWARGTSVTAPGICALVDKSDWALFGPDRIFPAGTPFFTDSTCSTSSGSGSILPFVYAATQGEAVALCAVAAPGTSATGGWDDPNVWDCAA